MDPRLLHALLTLSLAAYGCRIVGTRRLLGAFDRQTVGSGWRSYEENKGAEEEWSRAWRNISSSGRNPYWYHRCESRKLDKGSCARLAGPVEGAMRRPRYQEEKSDVKSGVEAKRISRWYCRK